ncbi:TPA: hypothetical protein ACH3X3_009573 [Trebouxia sp. C0006]
MGTHDAVPQSTTLGSGCQTPMHVSSLYVYPIKACKGCEVPRAIVETTGFPYDRYWMIVTEAEGRFVTQRQDATLALICTQLPQDACILGSKGHPDPKAALTLSGPGMPDVQVPLQPKSDPIWRSVRCHDWKGDAIDEGNEVADWLSKFLRQRVRLVKYGGVPGSAGLDKDSHRRSSAKGWYTGGQSETAFSDAFPFLVTCQASLHDLNTHLDIPISMNRFRPNIVLDGEQPAWAEDQWGNRNICVKTQEGSAVDLEMCKPCSRCTVPLVEQETADKASQPILAMKDFRLGKHLGFDKFGKYADTPVYRGGAVNNTTFFGWDAVPVQLGSVITVGDAVTVKGGNAALAYDAVTGRTSVVQQWLLLLSLRDAAALCTLLVVSVIASWLAYSLIRGFSHEFPT